MTEPHCLGGKYAELKKFISNIVRTTRFRNNLHQVRSKSQSQNICNPDNLKDFESKKTKGPEHDIQNPYAFVIKQPTCFHSSVNEWFFSNAK
jgi:hypothetical protein